MTVDLAGYQAALAEQKSAARASAQFGAAETAGVQVYLDVLHDLKADGVAAARRRRQPEPPGASSTRRPSPPSSADGQAVESAGPGDRVEVVAARDAVLRRIGRPGIRHGPHRLAGRKRGRPDLGDPGRRHPPARARPDRPRGRGRRRHPAGRRPGPARRRRRAPLDIMRNHTATHLLHRDAAPGAGRARAPGRLRGRARPPALRLHPLRAAERRAAGGRSSRASTTPSWPTTRSTSPRCATARPWPAARWPSSPRSTATRCASSGSAPEMATSARSCAAAPTSRTPARSASSTSCPRRASAPACGASRP